MSNVKESPAKYLSGIMEISKIKLKRNGSRALGTNPRALGTNPRALGTNPRVVKQRESKSE
jgi:hypothetical protein